VAAVGPRNVDPGAKRRVEFAFVCTLLIGVDAAAPRSVMLAANRDEDPARPSAPPGVLAEEPRVVGGRDLLKGGTWLAVRERRAAVAMLNRREETATANPARPSRGRLALDVAAAGDGGAAAALRFAREAAAAADYAPFSMVFASPEGSWLLWRDAGRAIESAPIAPGWHALTHADLDDREEPRTRWLLGRLAGFAPKTPAEAERALLDLLRSHGGGAPGAGPTPPVCLHAGRMVTVSSAVVHLARDDARYLHVEGRPCTGTAIDCTHLLKGRLPALERA
jgi:hypothetical protein